MEVGSIPQWITAVVAFGAGVIAIYSVGSQRQIARKRAALDIFVKTDMDDKMLMAYDAFHTAIEEMRAATSIEEFCTQKATRAHYFAIRKYLNVHELIAVGIEKEVLDKNVCYDYWGDVLMNGCSDARPLLDYLRTRPKNKHTYLSLEKLNAKWAEQSKSVRG